MDAKPVWRYVVVVEYSGNLDHATPCLTVRNARVLLSLAASLSSRNRCDVHIRCVCKQIFLYTYNKTFCQEVFKYVPSLCFSFVCSSVSPIGFNSRIIHTVRVDCVRDIYRRSVNLVVLRTPLVIISTIFYRSAPVVVFSSFVIVHAVRFADICRRHGF